MPHAMFGYPLALDDVWEDGSVHTYYLREGGEGSAQPPVGLSLAAQSQGDSFIPNVVVIREPKKDRTLEQVVEAHQRTLQREAPAAVQVSAGTSAIAGLTALEREIRVTLDRPLPALVQLHAFVERDGYIYHFCCTSTQQRYPQDKIRFRSLMGAWG